METWLLDLLRCPYCGTTLTLVENSALVRDTTRIESGVLGCECCAFPVVSGIPVLIANDVAHAAIHALERDAGQGDQALLLLLGLDSSITPETESAPPSDRAIRFRDLLSRPDSTTYRDTLRLLCPDGDAEVDYLMHRFSDPSYRVAEALLSACGQAGWPLDGLVLDLCGGAGHLTRAVGRATHAPDAVAPASPPDGDRTGTVTVTADLFFWKLWLATRFVSPGCPAVCCDANHPLPFPRNTFSTVVLADAFPYIWHKRLLADEMMRLVGATGTIVMPHLHSAHGDNFSAGDTLSPRAYHSLFADQQPRLYADSELFSRLVDEQVVDLSRPAAVPEDLGAEPSMTLVASHQTDLFTRYQLPSDPPVRDSLIINPLYRVTRHGRQTRLTLTFPTPEYAEEFAECRRYLPDTLTIDADLTSGDTVSAELVGDDYQALRRRQVILDAPRRYR
jgi:uncharacterized protein YbaR (Trm112 family)